MGKTVVLKGRDVPVLDRARSPGDVYGSDDGSRFYQDGHYFNGKGEYLWTDEESAGAVREQRAMAQTKAAVEQQVRVQAQIDPARTITEDELPELMGRPEAKDLMKRFSMPQIAAMMEKAGGPVMSGENAQQLMVAWLIKYTV